MKRTNSAKWVESVGRWQINVQKDGKRKTFVSSKPGRTGQREANAKADAWLEDGISNRRMTVNAAYAEYLDEQRLTTSTSNYRPKESRWRIHIQPVIGKLSTLSLSEQALQNVINAAYAKRLSKKTLKNIAGDLTAFAKFCRRSGYAKFYPEQLRIPDGAIVGERKILQPKQVARLMTSDKTLCKGAEAVDDMIHFYRLAVLTGMRPGELLGLEWRDVNGDSVQVRRSVNIYGEETPGKNKNARRAVPISPLAAKELKAQRKQTGKTPFVFPRYQEKTLLKHWYKYCDYNELPRVTLYELRHTFVSIAQSLPEGDVKALVGHSKSMDTFGVYAHTFDGRDEQLAARVNDLFLKLFGDA